MLFRSVSDIDESKVNPVAFFLSIDKIVMGEEGNSDFQCIGNVEDGQDIIWDNPNWGDAEHVVKQLKTISSAHGFECDVVDKRNKN